MVHAVQVHQCSKEACLVLKNDRLQCKRHAPFDLSPRDWIDEDGTWGPRRTNGYINNWNPSILHCVRSNHDIKLVTNVTETKDLTFYITNYVAKKQQDSSNVSALIAKRLAFHQKQEKYTVDANLLNKRLIQCCANTLSREQKFSAPEVCSYLRRQGDRFISDFFVPIYLDGFRSTFKKCISRVASEEVGAFIFNTLIILIRAHRHRSARLKESSKDEKDLYAQGEGDLGVRILLSLSA